MVEFRPAFAAAFTALACAAMPAQTQIQIDPRATFYRTNNDSASPAPAIPLTQLGVAPGQWLEIRTVGGFSHMQNYPDVNRNLTGVFSSSATLLSESLLNRVPGAIAAGPIYEPNVATWSGGLPMNIAEDFVACVFDRGNGVAVKVPAGATHVFVCVMDSRYDDNTDPNGDYAVVFTPLSAPGLPGTGEHLVLATGVNGPATVQPEIKNVSGAANVAIELQEPFDLLDPTLWFLVVDVIATGSPPNSLLPNVFIGPGPLTFVLTQGTASAAPMLLGSYLLQVPAGFNGITIVVQGVVLDLTMTRNGWYETSNAHQLRLM